MPEFVPCKSLCYKCRTILTKENTCPYYLKNGGYCYKCKREKSKAEYNKYKPKVSAYQKIYRKEHRQMIIKRRRQIKLTLFSHYSDTNPPQCANLYGIHEKPFTILEALQLDHINGGGYKEHQRLGVSGGDGFYRWLIKNNYPEGYQVLCANCNWIKRFKDSEHANLLGEVI